MLQHLDYDENPVYYVYHLVNPITRVPFYVGKGTRYRCKQHLVDTPETARNKRLNGHIRKLRESGIEPIIIKIKENMMERDAYELEESEIRKYGRIGFEEGGILMNLLLEARPPILRGEDNGFYGRHHTEETRRIIGEKNRGLKHTDESKEKIRQRHLGVPKSEEHRRKMSENAKGRPVKEETRQKLREHNLQPEVLKKNIESKQKVWIVITPDGEELEVVNLSDFCKERGLSRTKMYTVAAGKANHHKGYKCWPKYPEKHHRRNNKK